MLLALARSGMAAGRRYEQLGNPDLHDIPTSLPSRVEMWDRHAASTSVAIGHAAFDMAVATYSSERFTLRNGIHVIRENSGGAKPGGSTAATYQKRSG